MTSTDSGSCTGVTRNFATQFNWKIPDFSQAFPKKASVINSVQSPTFYVRADQDSKTTAWHVDLKSVYGGSAVTNELYLRLKLKSAHFESWPARCVRCSFYINYLIDKHKLHSISGSHEFCKSGFSTANCLSLASLYENIRLKSLQADKFEIQVKIRIWGDEISTLTSTGYPIKVSESKIMDRFISDLKRLAQDPAHSDVEIVCGTKTFHGMKAILSVRSEVFEKMFGSQMLEASTNRLVVTDLDEDIFECIFQYLCRGTMEQNKEGGKDYNFLIKLLHGAEKYLLSDLKSYCFEQLLQHLTVDTVGELVLLAESYNAETEFKGILKRFWKHNAAHLLVNVAFQKECWKHPELFVP